MKNQLPRKYKITCRVRRSDAPENLVSLRYVGMHNGDAGDTKMAEILVLSGFPPYRLKNNLYQRHKLKLVN